ncbi:MAG: hypothetical protein RL220_2092 [Bacteroidota bacterium]
MKKHYLLFALLIASGGLFAQDIQLVDPVYCVLGNGENPDDAEIDCHWGVINSSSSDMTIRVRREIVTEINGSRNKFCWGPLCYDWDTDESPTATNLLVVVPAGATNTTFSGYYQHQSNPGQTIVRYCFFDHYNSANETCTEVGYAVDASCTVGIQELTPKAELSLSGANPVVGTTNLTFAHEGTNARIDITNLLGAVVKTIPLDTRQGVVFLNSADFEQGTYLCNMVVDNAISSSLRIVFSN